MCNDNEIIITIDLNNNDIIEYHGCYIHERIVDLIEGMDDAIKQISKKIRIGSEIIKCRLIWTPDEKGWFGDREVVTAPGYYELEYMSGTNYNELYSKPPLGKIINLHQAHEGSDSCIYCGKYVIDWKPMESCSRGLVTD